MIEESLPTHVRTTAGVSALIGGTRLYPLKVPEGVRYPCVRWMRRTGPRTHTIGGPTGMAMGVFDFEALDTTYLGAKALAVQIRLSLDGYDLSRGPMGAAGSTTEVHSVAIDDEEDDYDYELLKYIVRSPFTVWYSEATE